jgi:Fe-S cluster assembly protein SufD
MIRSPAEDAFLEHFRALEVKLPGREPTWLEGLRREAIAAFAELGIPTTRQEDWRFTRLTTLAKTAFRSADAAAPRKVDDSSIAGPARAIGDAHRLVFLNGRFAPELSELSALPRGARIGSLAQSLAREPERLEPHLARCADHKNRAFSALNTALASDGLFVELDTGVVLEQPIHALFLQQTEGPPLAVHLRNLVVAAPGSRAQLIEHYLGSGRGMFLTNAVTEVVAGRDARLEHIKLQEEAEETYHVAGLMVRQEAGSRFASHSLSSGGRLMRFDIQTLLGGELAHCTLNGLYLARNTQHVDHHTTIDHAMPHTTSSEVYKGIMDGEARGVFHGRIHVRPDAQKINAKQTNRNLLLSDDATINTKPQLEIYADDVRCTHGATVGRLDEDALFYLRTRGIALEDARSLLTFAFASDVTRELPIAQLREHMEKFVLDWLPGGERIR